MKTILKVLGIVGFLGFLGFSVMSCGDKNVLSSFDHIHDSGAWHTKLLPDCTTDGLNELRCTDCGEIIDTEVVEHLGHEMVVTANTTKEPSCTEDGEGEMACDRPGCDYITPGDIIPALGHLHPDWIAPTCTVAGNSSRTCTRAGCGDVETRATGFAVLGHIYPDWIAPTCTVAGNNTRTCTRAGCGVVDSRTTGFAALGHDWNWPAHTTPGIRTCQRSGCSVTAGIGDTGPGGGIIFYVNAGGFDFYTGAGETRVTAYYLETARSHAGEDLNWSGILTLIPNLSQTAADATDWAIGRGRRNTEIIIAHGISNGYTTAAASVTRGGYNAGGSLTDWFLPSKDELNQLYLNRAAVNNAGGMLGDIGFWSSSQNDINGSWYHSFYHSFQGSAQKVLSACNVRAIRAF